jgi:hypothetical protein
MSEDQNHEQEEPTEAYHKVDKRDWLRDDDESSPEAVAEPSAEAALPEDEAVPAEGPESTEIDTYGVLRLCLSMFVEQAWVQLGLQLAPGASETKADLKQAKLAIDTVAYMKDALSENLQAHEQREVEQVLATLRMNFVQRS